MTLNFPSSPTVGDTYTSGNVSYVWEGTAWQSEGNKSDFSITDSYLGEELFVGTIEPSSPIEGDVWVNDLEITQIHATWNVLVSGFSWGQLKNLGGLILGN